MSYCDEEISMLILVAYSFFISIVNRNNKTIFHRFKTNLGKM